MFFILLLLFFLFFQKRFRQNLFLMTGVIVSFRLIRNDCDNVLFIKRWIVVECGITMDLEEDTNKIDGGGETNPGCSGYSGMVHSKKVIKHALRQQVKRRRKNTTIASGNSRALPRIVVKPLAPPPAPSPPSPPNDPLSSLPNMQHTTNGELLLLIHNINIVIYVFMYIIQFRNTFYLILIY